MLFRSLDDWSEVAKHVVLKKRSWSAFHRWLRVWQKLLTPTELRVALFIADRTIGYKKDTDKIKVSQFIEGVKMRDGKIIHLGSGAKDRKEIKKAILGLQEISFCDFNHRPGYLWEFTLIYQERLGEKPPLLWGKNPHSSGGKTPTSSTRQILQGRYNKDDDLKNLRVEFVKERGHEPFDEVELSVFKSQKAYREMR